jgi:uncharacterized protein YqgV (UPF0045/DUF77 family)
LTIGGWVKSNEEAPKKFIRFEIIIPKQEPKDAVLGYKTSLVAQMLDSNNKEQTAEPKCTCLKHDPYCCQIHGTCPICVEPETIEEAAERILSKEGVKLHPSGLETYLKGNVINAMVELVKWQSERMYSESIEFGEWIRIKDFQTTSKDNWIGLDMKYYTTKELFEQFKK